MRLVFDLPAGALTHTEVSEIHMLPSSLLIPIPEAIHPLCKLKRPPAIVNDADPVACTFRNVKTDPLGTPIEKVLVLEPSSVPTVRDVDRVALFPFTALHTSKESDVHRLASTPEKSIPICTEKDFDAKEDPAMLMLTAPVVGEFARINFTILATLKENTDVLL